MFLDFLHKRLINDFIEDDDFVGLVFSGYGEADIFPAFFEIRFSGLINGKVKYQVYRKSAITDKNPSEIASFAQSEMAATFMEGINPELEETISSSLISNLKKLQNDISEKFKINVDEMNDLFRDTYSKVRIELDDKKHTEMVRPVIETVSILRKEDLIEVAESLVGITSLKRKTSLEIETVGGPVDIAIITKSEGFVWVKRKEKLNGF